MSGRARVLLVDDHPSVLEPLESRLRALGYHTVVAHDGAAALEAVRREPPDLVVLDVMMPEVNGFQVCREIKRLHPALPVILLTAKSDAADRFWASECGASAFLTKPADPGVVARHVASLLDGS